MELCPLTQVQHRIRIGSPLPFSIRDAGSHVLLAKDQVVSDAALAAAGVPTLGLVGSRDEYRDAFRELARVMPQLTLVEIEGAAHGQALERAEFRDALLAFLQLSSRARQAGKPA